MKVIDVRIVIDDDVLPSRVVNRLVSNRGIFGAAILQNNGFGHMLPTGWRLVGTDGRDNEPEVHQALDRPDMVERA